jgi:peptidoglycan/LPS O-acetylase OafA/YrhL
MSSSPHYRPDIDGLRAVALLLVILFHAGLGFQGGYIGVDVFFVISGFLITGQVIRELDAGEFSLANFWARRIRRLLPAATVMMVAVLFAGYFLLLPGDYVHLGWSAVAQQLLSANLYFRFWSEFGYFNPWTEENPLLHTWSLAVEEQFYLLYPLLLITLHGWGRRTMQLVLAGLALASLAGCEACLRWDAESAYYLLPTRAWELLLGGLVALCPGPVWVPRRVAPLVSVLGMATILACGWRYRSHTWFPGLMALPPCLATAALIHVNARERSLPARLLSMRPLVLVGLMSYSLYLWHWPITAFYRYWTVQFISRERALLLIGAGVVPGLLSWWLIERPFRRWGARAPRQTCFIAAGVTTLCGLLLAGLIVMREGWSDRIAPQLANQLAESSEWPVSDLISRWGTPSRTWVDPRLCPAFGDSQGASACLLWGDSHAGSLVLGLEAACLDLGMRAYLTTIGATPPLLHHDGRRIPSLGYGAHPRFRSDVLEAITRQKIHVVILAGMWTLYPSRPGFEKDFEATVNHLTELGTQVIIVQDVPEFRCNIPRRIGLAAMHHQPHTPVGLRLERHRFKNRGVDALFARLARENPRVATLDLSELFLEGGDTCWSEIDGQILFRDQNHLARTGSRRVAPLLKQALEMALRRQTPDSGTTESGSRKTDSIGSPTAPERADEPPR